MDLLSIVVDGIENFLSRQKHLLCASADEIIDLKNFKAREQLIGALEKFIAELPNIANKVELELDAARRAREQELSAANILLAHAGKRPCVTTQSSAGGAKNTAPTPPAAAIATNDATEWITVVKKSAQQNLRCKHNTINAVMVNPFSCLSAAPASAQSTPNKYSNIKLTEALYLPAICVATFDQVKQDGELYYVDSADHFAVKIAGRLLHGNIGTIFTDEKRPEKISECRYGVQCTKGDRCEYYHDPLSKTGSKDYRNYVASSWLYGSADSTFGRRRGRRFGSRDNLDRDIVALQPDEISRFADQTMHDILCTLLLMFVYKKD